jgi:hypothetical protein
MIDDNLKKIKQVNTCSINGRTKRTQTLIRKLFIAEIRYIVFRRLKNSIE